MQARLPGATMVEDIVKKTTDGAKVYANSMVRVRSDTQKIDKFFPAKSAADHNYKPTGTAIDTSKTETVYEVKTDAANPEIEINESTTNIQATNKIPNILIDDIDVDKAQATFLMEEENREQRVVEEKRDKWTDKGNPNPDNANLTFIDPKESFKTRTFKYERVETKLTSVKQLRLAVENKCNLNLREILANFSFIACIDCHKSLIQHSTKLYLCDTTKLT